MGLKESGLRASLRSVSTGVSAIPDSDIYLQDDWGDNKLTDREDSGTTTHNGVEGVYRPEWETLEFQTTPSVDDGELEVGSGEGIYTDINLNLDEQIHWEFDIDFSDGGSGGSNSGGVILYSETVDEASFRDSFVQNSYVFFFINRDGGDIRLLRYDDDDDSQIVADDGLGNDVSVEITRSPGGEWELIIDDSSVGTGTDDTYTDVNYTGFTARDEIVEFSVNEYKVS